MTSSDSSIAFGVSATASLYSAMAVRHVTKASLVSVMGLVAVTE